MLVACSTALPRSISPSFFLDEILTPSFVGRLMVASALLWALTFTVLTWRRRHVWMARLSLPLVGYTILCGIGLAMVVLITQPPHYLTRVGLDDLRGMTNEFDIRHVISYLGFAVIAAIAWRGRVRLPVLGILLMAYGYCLELVQELVPTRSFRIQDLVSNGWGILLALCWVHLYDSLFGIGSTRLSWPARGSPARADAMERHASTQGQLASPGNASCTSELSQQCSDVTRGEGPLLARLYTHGDKLSGQCD